VQKIEKLLRWANIFFVIITLLTYLSPSIDPAKVWQFSFLGLSYPFLLIFHLFFIGYWAFKKHWYFLFSAACILVGWGYFTGFFGLSFFKNPGAGNLTVLTYNTGGFKNFVVDKGEKMEQKLKKLQALAAKAGNVEILCVQETRTDVLIGALRQAFGFSHFFKKEGTVIFSKYPFVAQGEVPFGRTSNSCIWADLKTPEGTLRVYCVHLQSNKMSFTANKIATKGDLREKQTWKDIRFVLSRYKTGAQIRAKQVQEVTKHIAASPHPVLVCGDFNEPPLSYAYRQLSKNLQDSFREKGAGLGTTFAGRIPFLRIDYVLADKHFRVVEHRVLRAELSDHLPVWVKLKN
jgi:endonuclease/exonuclease/phosphatase family metal-dependent hydrolase